MISSTVLITLNKLTNTQKTLFCEDKSAEVMLFAVIFCFDLQGCLSSLTDGLNNADKWEKKHIQGLKSDIKLFIGGHISQKIQLVRCNREMIF